MGSAPAHLLGTIIMKFLLVVAVVVVAAVDAFVLPVAVPSTINLYQAVPSSSYLADRPVPDHDVLLHDGLYLHPVQVPGVPAVYASAPAETKEKRQADDEVDYEVGEEEDEEADPAYLGVPFGALGLNIGSAYGALALWRPGTPYWLQQPIWVEHPLHQPKQWPRGNRDCLNLCYFPSLLYHFNHACKSVQVFCLNK